MGGVVGVGRQDAGRQTVVPAQESFNATSSQLRAILNALPALVGYWDASLHNVMANDAYVEFFGITPEQMRGIHIRDLLGDELYALNAAFMQRALAGEAQLFDREIPDTQGRIRYTQASYLPDVVDGEVRGFFVMVTDISPRRQAEIALEASVELQARALDENQTLLRELHHRVKNNLQVMSSLMSFQAERQPEGSARDGFIAAQSRVHAIAALHDQLSGVSRFAEIDLVAYAERILADISLSFGSADRQIGSSVSGGPLVLPVDVALPCAMVISELVTNSFKHAFVGRSNGNVFVRIEHGPGERCCLVVGDDGVGIDAPGGITARHNLGLDLVDTFVEQIDATPDLAFDVGTTATITFEIPAVIGSLTQP